MSWQAYVDTTLVGSGNVDKAAIFNREGTSVWASSPGFQVNTAEIKEIIDCFATPTNAFAKGFHVGGDKYMTVRADERTLVGKKGKSGIVCVATKQAILIGHHPDDGLTTNTTNTVESLADYLIGAGY